MPQLTRDSQVYQRLRERILKGAYRPGTRLIEQELCADLRVSRTPLRLALRQLEHDGLIERVPYRGCVIREVSLDEFRELFGLREMLEGLAARTVAAAAHPEHMNRLRQIAENCDTTAASGNWTRYIDHDREFHRTLIGFSGNKRLMQLMEVFTFQIQTFAVYHQFPPRVIEALQNSAHQRVREHQLLVEAIASGDPDRAEKAIRQHIRRGLDIVLDALKGSAA